MKTISIFMFACCAAIGLVFFSPITHAQNLFDTQIAFRKPVVNNVEPPSLRMSMERPDVFDRSRTIFEFGLNFGGIGSRNGNEVFGTSIFDDNFYPTRMDVSRPILAKMPDGSKMILVEGSQKQFFEFGHGIMTRVDPEVQVGGDGRPIMESGVNSGALHGFATSTTGTVNGKFVELRTTDIGTFSANTNKNVWLVDAHDRYAFHKILAAIPPDGTLNGDDHPKYYDPMKTGEMMVVSICLRRVGEIMLDANLTDETPVVSIRVRRQQRKRPYEGPLPPPNPYVTDNVDARLISFSLVPETPSVNNTAPLVVNIGTEQLPLFFRGFDDKITAPLGQVGTYVPWYKDMTLAGAVSSTNLTAREMVWQNVKDVRDNVINEAASKVMVITAGMLKALIDHPSTPGADPEKNDGTSYWTLFDGLIVFGQHDKTVHDGHLFKYQGTLQGQLQGMGARVPNEAYVRNGRRGHPLGLNEGDVVDVNIEVEYHGLANVDFEYLVQQSPNSRAMMRDQYRAAIEEDLRLSIEGFVEARHDENQPGSFPDNPNNPRSLHLLGIRSVEERGEEQWYSQRYMNILTNGAMISEIAIHPFDRYAHCAYPFTTSGSDYPTNPLPLAVWNETSTGRLDPFNPAPFLARGYQSGSNTQHTLGLKYGACGTNQTVAHGYCRNLNLLGSEKDRVVRILTDNYEIGWPPSDYNTNIGDFVGRAKFFSEVVPKIWEAPQSFEVADTDLDATNDFPPHAGLGTPRVNEEWEPCISLSTTLYSNFISPGNQKMLFSGIPWYEQVWLGTGKTIHRIQKKDRNYNIDPWYSFMTDYSSQARPQTAEEVRQKLVMPVILGASGVIAFLGTSEISLVKPEVKPPPAPQEPGFGSTTSSMAWLFNVKAKKDAEETNVSEVVFRQRCENDIYGTDYPIYDGTTPTLNLQYSENNNNYYHKTEGYLKDFIRIDASPMVPEKLWISKLAYTDAIGDAIGGLDIVQRVNVDGTIYNTPHDVERVYFGSYSARREVLKYTDWLNKSLSADFGEYLGHPDPPIGQPPIMHPTSVAQLLGLLQLESWYARAYKEFKLWRDMEGPNPLSKWMNLDKVRSRHPYRTFNGRADYESLDSMFVDVTLLHRKLNYDGSVPSGSPLKEVYIGVHNRRTNPLYMKDESPNEDGGMTPKFSSAQEYYALVKKSSGTPNEVKLYDQVGSRAVVLPFDYQYESSEQDPYLLQIMEVGVGDVATADYRNDVLYSHANTGDLVRNRVDTIIDPRNSLEVELLPGEAKLLRVRLIPATKVGVGGNLAFSTQTKIVSAPIYMLQGGNSVPTGDIQYHMVYTKPNQDGYSRVYYKRSIPVKRDNLEFVAGLKWEELPGSPTTEVEYEIGNQIDVLRSGPGVRGTIYQAGPPDFHIVYPPGVTMIDHDAATEYIQAAFPSIAIARGIVTNVNGTKADTIIKSVVHIVYAAGIDIRDISQPDPNSSEIHIVEHVFEASADPTLQRSKSLSIIHLGNYIAPGMSAERLSQYGTPTNGVSTFNYENEPDLVQSGVNVSDRVFTAWSVKDGVGITSAVKSTWQPLAPLYDQAYYGVGEWDVLPLTQNSLKAQYPSLTPTASAVGGKHATASLVWQEKSSESLTDPTIVNGWAIMYTRLWEDARVPVGLYGRHQYGISGTLSMHYDTGLPPASHGIVIYPDITMVLPPPPVFQEHVMRISGQNEGQTNLYATISRSKHIQPIGSQAPFSPGPFTLRFSGYTGTACPNDPQPTEFSLPFQFEEITWQSMDALAQFTKVMRRYFIHDDIAMAVPEPGPNIRYWWIGSTWSLVGNYVAPVISLAHQRHGEQVYRKLASPLSLAQYWDPCYDKLTIQGNISDTSLISAFGILNVDLTTQDPKGSLAWNDWGAIASIEQVNLRYVPIPPHNGSVPLPPHIWSMNDGVWPHISHGSISMPVEKQNLRRIQQVDNGTDVDILVSAESFYKGGTGLKQRVKGGLHAGSEGLSVGGMFTNGREVVFRRESEGKPGILEQMVQAFSTQATSLVSNEFYLKNLDEVELDYDGELRAGLTLSIEEVDLRGKSVSGSLVQMGLPSTPEKTAQSKRKYARFLFRGLERNVRYRFRIDGPVGFVAFEETITEDLSRSFSKAASEEVPLRVVELSSGIVEDLGSGNSIVVAPTPTSLTLEVRSFFNSTTVGPYILRIQDVAGKQRMVRTISRSEQLSIDVQDLENGTYMLHVSSGDGIVVSKAMVVYR